MPKHFASIDAARTEAVAQATILFDSLDQPDWAAANHLAGPLYDALDEFGHLFRSAFPTAHPDALMDSLQRFAVALKAQDFPLVRTFANDVLALLPVAASPSI